MKILVTGASGLLGLNLGLRIHDRYQIIGLDRGKLANTPFELVRRDLLDPEACFRLMDSVRPDAIIHTAALANLEACEKDPESARLLNEEAPGLLAEECNKRDVQFIHISTDAVFDGTKEGVYTEEDAPNPASVYAKTKLNGEENVLSVYPKAAIARVNFFGWSLSGTKSLSEFFVNNLSAEKKINGFNDVYFCPLFVGDLAETLLEILEKNLSGLYHAVGSRALSKYRFGQEIATIFGFDAGLIRPISLSDSALTAKRSTNLRLSVHKLSTALGHEIPDFSTGLAKFYTQYQQGYPQKMRGYQQNVERNQTGF